ncbi:MAG: glycosyltransferase family 39 protein [Planctomycetes bacterium]|nr:glycosyltransferase family 39 protein [Planctomycetota bacterium]
MEPTRGDAATAALDAPWPPAEKLVLAAILAGAAALYLSTLTVNGLFADEITTASLQSLSFGELMANRAVAGHLPLYFALLWLWEQAAGNGEFAVRFPSVLAALGGIALVYALVRRSWDAATAASAAVLLALSPAFLHFAQMARMYSLVVLLALACLYAIQRGGERSGWRWPAVLAVMTGLLLSTSYSGLLALVPLAVYVLARRRPTWRLAAGLAAGLALAAPAVLYQRSVSLEMSESWDIQTSLAHLELRGARWLSHACSAVTLGMPAAHYAVANFSAPGTALVLAALALGGAVCLGRRVWPWVLLWAGPLLLAMVLTEATATNLVHLRYFAVAAAAQAVLLAGLCRVLGRWPKLRAGVTAVLALALGALTLHELSEPWQRSDRAMARAACEARGERDELLLLGTKGWIRLMDYYGSPPFRLIDFDPVVARAPGGSHRSALEDLRAFRAAPGTARVWVLANPATVQLLEAQGADWKALLGRDPQFGPFKLKAKDRGVQLWFSDRK